MLACPRAHQQPEKAEAVTGVIATDVPFASCTYERKVSAVDNCLVQDRDDQS